MTWFHGRGEEDGRKPIINIHHNGNWKYTTISLLIGCTSAYTKKLCSYFYDHGVSAGYIGETEIEIDFNRWTHLAMTHDQTNGNR